MENERNFNQAGLMKDELEKQKKDLAHVKKTSDSISDKIYKTQNYLRNLTREEVNTGEQLTRLEDDNNYLDNCLEEMQLVIDRNNEEANILRKENEALNYEISSKELDRKKL